MQHPTPTSYNEMTLSNSTLGRPTEDRERDFNVSDSTRNEIGIIKVPSCAPLNQLILKTSHSPGLLLQEMSLLLDSVPSSTDIDSHIEYSNIVSCTEHDKLLPDTQIFLLDIPEVPSETEESLNWNSLLLDTQKEQKEQSEGKLIIGDLKQTSVLSVPSTPGGDPNHPVLIYFEDSSAEEFSSRNNSKSYNTSSQLSNAINYYSEDKQLPDTQRVVGDTSARDSEPCCHTLSATSSDTSLSFNSLTGLKIRNQQLQNVVSDRLPQNKISCRERKRILLSSSRPPGLTKAMKQWITKTHNLLDPFREDSDCWLHPSPPPARLTTNSILRPRGKVQKTFTWQDRNGTHSLTLNYGIVSRLINYKITKEQKDGFLNNQWHLSHLCGNWTCLNPAHTTVEPGVVNISRNNCFSHRSGCLHNPPCMKDKKLSLGSDGKLRESIIDLPGYSSSNCATQQSTVEWDDWSFQTFDDGEESMSIDDNQSFDSTMLSLENGDYAI